MLREAGLAVHLRESLIKISEVLIHLNEGLILITVVVATVAVAEEEEGALHPTNPLSQCSRRQWLWPLLHRKLPRSCMKLNSGWLNAANAGHQRRE